MPTIALVSGGIDSVVMCKILEKQGEKIIPIFIDYGQLSNEKEWDSCLNLFELSNLPKPKKVDLSGFGKEFPSGITSKDKDIKNDAFLPCRNLLFLLVGAAEAFQEGAENISIGLLTEESHLFPDQTEEFIINSNFAVNSALGKNLIILTPLINFKKEEIIQLAKEYDIDLSKTYSCHKGGDKYCGECISCQEILDTDEKLPQFE